MFLSLLRGAMVVSKCQAMNNKKSRKPCMLGWPLTAIIVSTDVSHELQRGEG